MSTKSPLSTICLVACANRASSRSIGRNVEKAGQEHHQAAQHQERDGATVTGGRKVERGEPACGWNSQVSQTVGLLQNAGVARFQPCCSHTMKPHCKQHPCVGPLHIDFSGFSSLRRSYLFTRFRADWWDEVWDRPRYVPAADGVGRLALLIVADVPVDPLDHLRRHADILADLKRRLALRQQPRNAGVPQGVRRDPVGVFRRQGKPGQFEGTIKGRPRLSVTGLP